LYVATQGLNKSWAIITYRHMDAVEQALRQPVHVDAVEAAADDGHGPTQVGALPCSACAAP
jgi:hypothetical protein